LENSKVLIVFNPITHTKDSVKKELEQEGYKHYFSFYFESPVFYENKVLENSDEVWFFGNCEKLPIYDIIKNMGKDCWQMA